ncbi:Sec-independent protein translocase protein TatA [Caenibius tardaugens NBRC 16725]|uniref:Sec-independent protein translocase protein TatA n=1 Tax=Caenibius tardaugens NBRC 16725 TaxID=1219035 RepID=U2Y8D7_9SPHN|nr:twin-arginine translocase TatA/TatE family subunit [Caenibius tardaugens]AZI36816.1 twin-arginine translocase TatA/TatE family subunit [Caenibius tardaugens NBRC 16725]GAD49496.1 Sec-independent protein translocase protein TatA [Caenibius tardaugens NBRC 16725]
MGSMSLTHWIIVAIVVLILFGRGRISETMGEFGKGLRSFKQGMSEKDEPEAPGKASQISQTPPEAEKTAASTDRATSDR